MEENEILDTSLLIEGKTGLTTAFNVVEYPKALEQKVEVVWPAKEDFMTAIGIMVDLLKSGTPVPALDVLIAAICVNRGFKLLTKDEHFRAIGSVRPAFRLSLV